MESDQKSVLINLFFGIIGKFMMCTVPPNSRIQKIKVLNGEVKFLIQSAATASPHLCQLVGLVHSLGVLIWCVDTGRTGDPQVDTVPRIAALITIRLAYIK